MGNRIGIIAGSGKFPLLALNEAQRMGYTCLVAGIKKEAEETLEDKANSFEWVGAGEISKLVSFFKQHRVQEAIMVGKISPRILYDKENFDEVSFRLLSNLKERTPTSILKTIIDFMASEGIQIMDPTFLLSPFFCQEGILTNTIASKQVFEDITFGWKIAKNLADLDIGQTVVVKERAIVAIEAQEGTDQAILRAGNLAGKGTVVVKASRTFQDPRIDIPAVGLKTLKSIVKVGGIALCIEAQKIPFFQKEEAVSLANTNGILIMAKKA